MRREEIGRGGQVLGRGVASWELNQNASKAVDFSLLPSVGPGEPVILSVRNGSPTVDLTAHYGNLVQCCALADMPEGVTCTMNDSANTVTKAGHGLQVGDAIRYATTVGGVTVGVDYYIVETPDANTFQFSETRGGAAFEITADGSNSYSIAAEHFIQGTLTVEKFAAASSTTPVAGMEEVVLYGAAAPFRVLLTKSAAAAAAFTAYVEIRRA